MNKIILLGRLVKDPELRHTENGEKNLYQVYNCCATKF